MSKVDTLETAFLQVIFNAKAYSTLWSNAASTPSTTIWVSLHTADPLDTGTQATNETTYAGYLRVATDRTTGANGWTVSGTSPASASPNTTISFAQCTSSSTTVITHFSVGLSSSGAGTSLYNGTVTSNISVTNGVTPQLATSSTVTED